MIRNKGSNKDKLIEELRAEREANAKAAAEAAQEAEAEAWLAARREAEVKAADTALPTDPDSAFQSPVPDQDNASSESEGDPSGA